MSTQPFTPALDRQCGVEVKGHTFMIAFDIDGPEEAETHHFFGNTPRRGRYCVAQFVKLGNTWHDVLDIFSSDFNDEIDAALNMMPFNDE